MKLIRKEFNSKNNNNQVGFNSFDRFSNKLDKKLTPRRLLEAQRNYNNGTASVKDLAIVSALPSLCGANLGRMLSSKGNKGTGIILGATAIPLAGFAINSLISKDYKKRVADRYSYLLGDISEKEYFNRHKDYYKNRK